MINLKKYVSFVFVLFAMLAVVNAQKKPKIKGSRAVVEVSESLPKFNAIHIKDDIEVSLKKSFEEGYLLTADDNLTDIIKLEVQDGTLEVSSYYQVTSKKELKLEIRYTSLNKLIVQNGVLVATDVLNADMLDINQYGNSKLDLNVSAIAIRLNVEEDATLKLNLDADSVSVMSRGKAKLDLNSRADKLSFEILDRSNVNVLGAAQEMQIAIFQDGKLDGELFQVNHISLKAREESFVRINAIEKVDLQLSGKSKTYLFSSPTINLSLFEDSAQLHKKSN